MSSTRQTESAEVKSEDPEPRGTSADPVPKVKKRRELGVDPSLIISEERSKRRKTPTPEPEDVPRKDEHDPKDPVRAKQLGMEIYGKVLKMEDNDGLSMSQPFIKLPNKRAFPDYYEIIAKPMSLEMVHAKLESSQYETVKDVCADLGQIFTNAKRYNVKESLLFLYAKRLHKLVRNFYTDSTNPQKAESDSEPEEEPTAEVVMEEEMGEDGDADGDADGDGEGEGEGDAEAEVEMDANGAGPSDPGLTRGGRVRRMRRRGGYMKDGPTVYKLVKPVLKAIKDAKARDGTGREIAGIFLELPDPKLFEDYYKAILKPISLQEIEERMMARLYETWEFFFEDVELMCANAMLFNEDESEVFKDAQQIKDILNYYRGEVKHRLSQPQVQKFRVKQPSITPLRQPNPPNPVHIDKPYKPRALNPPMNPSYPQQSHNSYNAGSATYLPPLPTGVVTEDIVNNLDRYPPYEQRAWIEGLPPQAIELYRQIQSAKDARKLGGQGISPLPTERDFSERINGTMNQSMSSDRKPVPDPSIKHIDFTFSLPTTHPNNRPTVRLYNLRGVVTHAVIVSSDTYEIELTAYLATSAPKQVDNGVVQDTPELSLRMNGNPGSLPKYVFGESQSQKDKPTGMRWTISLPTSRTEVKLEIVVTKPGSLAETCTIFVNRQY